MEFFFSLLFTIFDIQDIATDFKATTYKKIVNTFKRLKNWLFLIDSPCVQDTGESFKNFNNFHAKNFNFQKALGNV